VTRWCSSAWSWLARRVSSRQRPTSSRPMPTCTESGRSASQASSSSKTRRCSRCRLGSLAARSGSRSCRCQRNRFWIRVRSATRSSRWPTSSLISRAGPSRWAWGRLGSGNAARATASASIGSDLPGGRLAWRALAIRRGGTNTTCSPAASRSVSSRPATCRQSSTAQVRSGTAQVRSGQRWRAQAISSWWSLVRVARVVAWVSCRPTWLAATTVWLALWGSTPSVTIIQAPPVQAAHPGRASGHGSVGQGHAPIKPRWSARVVMTGGTMHGCQPRSATPSVGASPPPAAVIMVSESDHDPKPHTELSVANQALCVRRSGSCLPWHPIIRRMRLDHPFDHPDDPFVSVGSRLDRQPNVSRLDPSGAVQVDAEHPSRNRKGGGDLSPRAPEPLQLSTYLRHSRCCASCEDAG
jgi:hypothetical protein